MRGLREKGIKVSAARVSAKWELLLAPHTLTVSSGIWSLNAPGYLLLWWSCLQ